MKLHCLSGLVLVAVVDGDNNNDGLRVVFFHCYTQREMWVIREIMIIGKISGFARRCIIKKNLPIVVNTFKQLVWATTIKSSMSSCHYTYIIGHHNPLVRIVT